MKPDINLLNRDDRYFMSEAVKEARKALEAEEVPIGAVVVQEGSIIARSHNQVETLKDATAHAEMIALTQAASAIGDWRLTGCTLYVTKEPCPMCAGAIILSRVSSLVYALQDNEFGGFSVYGAPVQSPKASHLKTVSHGVLADGAQALFTQFFDSIREKQR